MSRQSRGTRRAGSREETRNASGEDPHRGGMPTDCSMKREASVSEPFHEEICINLLTMRDKQLLFTRAVLHRRLVRKARRPALRQEDTAHRHSPVRCRAGRHPVRDSSATPRMGPCRAGSCTIPSREMGMVPYLGRYQLCTGNVSRFILVRPPHPSQASSSPRPPPRRVAAESRLPLPAAARFSEQLVRRPPRALL